jgi:hypothetical protein
LGERAVAGDGCPRPGLQHDTWFTLYTTDDETDNSTPQSRYVWRAEVPRVYDATRRTPLLKWSRPQETAPTPLVLPPEMKSSAPQSLTLQTSTRLPSPIIGCHATSPVLLDPTITRITHKLRLEVVFSVLGEDEQGEPLVIKSSKSRGPKPPEGAKRRLWVEHPVVLRCCILGPDNTKVPAYDQATQSEESFHDYLDRVGIRKTPKSFDMQSTDQGRDVGEGGDLRERVEEHAADCVARCLCFYGDKAVFELVKRECDPVNTAIPPKAAYP